MPTVRAADAEIAYEVQGDGDPVLLVMGFGMIQEMWMGQVPALATRHRVITFDNRGVGRSSAPPGPYTTEQMAEDALAVLDAAEAARAHVVGVSMGGAISQHLALKAPERVRSLVLAATWPGRNPWLDRLIPILERIGLELDRPSFVRMLMLLLFTPRFLIEQPDLVATVEGFAESMDAPVEPLVAQGRACLTHDARDRLGQIRAPTCVVGGRRDAFIPPELSEELAVLIPEAELHLMESGHAFLLEDSREFNRVLLDFLARH